MSVLTRPAPTAAPAPSATADSLRPLLDHLRALAGVEVGWTPAGETPARGLKSVQVLAAGLPAGWLTVQAAGVASATLEAAAALAGEWLACQAEAASAMSEAQQAREQIDLLVRIAGSLNPGSDCQRVCESILEESGRILNARSATLRLRDAKDGESLCLAARTGTGSAPAAAGEESIDVPVLRPRPSEPPEELGVLSLKGKRDGGRFSAADFKLAQALAHIAGVLVHYSRLLEEARRGERTLRDRQIAREIQGRLLPGEDPRLYGIEVAAACVPSEEVGGDNYGYLAEEQGVLGLMVADVSGHGIPAAVAMAGVRSLLRAEAARTDSPAAALRSVNRLLARDLQPSGLFATAFLARYEESGRRLRYCGAGHPPALLWRAAEGRFERLESGGLALGIFEDVIYEEGETFLAAGDLAVIFTDGLTETRNPAGEFFTQERLCQAAMRHRRERPRTLMYRLLEAVEEFRAGQPQRDDLTLLVLRATS